MKEKGVSKVSVVTSIGAGESYDQAPLVFKFAMSPPPPPLPVTPYASP
jgi:hypothetical protein